MSFERGKTVKPLTRVGDSDKTGTKVTWFADSEIFDTLDYDYETYIYNSKHIKHS